ncbi:tetratricopeptide repeat protein [Micromonospora sp. WMMD1102]|uniref:tetratricopeptide repeat protein n=1 Tax=Micromonospora sp. WMMD1102 TaxID=3016105 RepID=UPI00241546F3|nr:tetratricopeptide repeat protein [Micromonospora sp. WMMD1102]MDG4785204.1 tetratricopeptide repeat protein [Micromonospora sp. WMMD1102]
MPHRARRTSHGIQRSEQWEQPTPRRIGRESRAAPAALPVPRTGPALGWQLLSSLALLAALVWIGRAQLRAGRPDTWLLSPLDGLAIALGGDGAYPMRQRLGLLLIALVCFAAWRHRRRVRLAYRPGPVDVHEFTDATPDHNAPVDDLKSQFCQRLSETHIYPPYAGPADPPPETFLDVASGVDPRTGNPLAMLLQMLPRLWPRIGYRVTGVLQVRAQEPCYGVSATVTSFLGGGRSAMTTQWGGTWEEATGRAAYWVLATILPVTRLGRAAPWRNWYGRELPSALFAAYNRGKESQDRRQFDEALRYYGEALGLDPFNADLRVMVASVQEEMGLFLDALDTYQSALVLREQGGWYDDHVWTTRADRLRHLPRHLLGTLRYLRRRPDSIRLRYQYACTLAYTERTVHQWFKSDGVGDREKVRRQMRQRLEKAFVDRYWPVVVTFADAPGEPAAKEWLRRTLREYPEATRVVFQIAAAQELYRLREDTVLAWFVRATRSEVTHSALLLLRDVWAPLRLARAWHDWAAAGWQPARPGTATGPLPDPSADGGRPVASVGAGQPPVSSVGAGQPPAGPVGPFEDGGCLAGWWRRGPRTRARTLSREWPCGGVLLDRAIRRAQRRRWPRQPLRSFDFYNAACTYAFALKGYFPEREHPAPAHLSAAGRALWRGRRLIADALPLAYPPRWHRRPAAPPAIPVPPPAIPVPPPASPAGSGSPAGSPDGAGARPDGATGAVPPEPSPHPLPPPVASLVAKAVEQLRAALACTESGVAADRLRRWILSSEPDLAPLRRLQDFGYFEEEVYPSLKVVLPRPDKVINSRMSAYAKELLCQGAVLLEQTWHDRALPPQTADPHQLIGWLGLDAETWDTLCRIALDHARYWRDRTEFIRLLRRAVDPVRLAEARFPPSIPRYDDLSLAGADRLVGDGSRPEENIERLARHNIALVDRRLNAIYQTVAEHAGDGSLRARRRLAELDYRGEPLRGDEAQGICTRQAGRWHQVAERMRETGPVVDTSGLGVLEPRN